MDPEQSNFTNILITFFLVFLNGFFVAAEFAIVKVRSSQIETTNKKFVAAIARNIINNIEGYLAATQLGITLASLALGVVGEETFTKIILNIIHENNMNVSDEMAHKLAIPAAFACITFLHIVFGELVPKSMGIRYPYKTTMFVSPILKFFRTLFYPIILVLNSIANFILKLLGLNPADDSEIHSEEELKLIIAESAEGGAIDDNERDLIHNVFDFDNRIVREIFKHNIKVVGISAETDIEDAVKLVLEEGYSRYPVYQDSKENIVGMLHSKDLLKNIIEKKKVSVNSLMRKVEFIPENWRVIDLLKKFQEKKTEFAVVVDELGSTVGIVTLEDVLEELVGDIQDEHDQEVAIVELIGDNKYRILAQNSIDDINEHIPFDFPLDEDYETLSGLITKVNKDILNVGDVIKIDQCEITVVKMFRTSPEIVEVTLVPKENPEGEKSF